MLPSLYPIVDAANFSTSLKLCEFSKELIAGGAMLIQYRNKKGSAREILSQARQLRTLCGDQTTLFMNDRADLCLSAGFDGVHVGQDDLSPKGVRLVVGKGRIIGVSTHNPEQLAAADASEADYLAIGPVFPTSTKDKPDPVVGL